MLLFRDTSLSLDFLFFRLIFRLLLNHIFLLSLKKGLNVLIGSSRLGEHLLFRRSYSVCVYRSMCKCLANLFLTRNMKKHEIVPQGLRIGVAGPTCPSCYNTVGYSLA